MYFKFLCQQITEFFSFFLMPLSMGPTIPFSRVTMFLMILSEYDLQNDPKDKAQPKQ